MKHHFSYAVLIISLVFFSCQKVTLNQNQTNEKTLNQQAELFYSNLSEIIKATSVHSSMTKSALNSELNHDAQFYLENDIDYPVQAKLATVDIELEDGSIINFFDLPDEEQAVFVDLYTQHQAKTLSRKIELIPQLEPYVAAQNEIVSDVLASLETKSGHIIIDDPKAFFAVLSNRINEMTANYLNEDSSITDTKSGSGSTIGSSSSSYTSSEFEVSLETARNIMSGKAKKGDIIVALPCHEYPKSLIDFGNKRYMVGHAEIFTQNITATTSKDDYTTIGAWTEEGVQYQQFSNWLWKSYVLGVCSYKIQWRWRGLNSGFYVIQTPVSNPASLATWAEKYEGKSYVYWYEFATAKWAAPERFTCTSLVWWCAKKAYGERISPWLSTLVTPADVLCDYNTYLKATVQ